MSRLLIVVFLCLCAASSFAKFEVIRPDAIGDLDEFDSTGTGATKTIRITDGIDANYIFSATSGLSDRYNLGDLTSTDIGGVDSIVVYWTGQDNGNGNNRIRIGIRINVDETFDGGQTLGTGWVEYNSSFTEGPNSRAWTKERIDSLVFIVNVSAIGASREARMTECSVVVFYQSSERTLMYPDKNDACLSVLGQIFDHDLLRKSTMQNDTAFIEVTASTTPPSFWKTGDAVTTYHKMNNDDWETGGFGIFMDVRHVKSDCSLTISIQRYNSSCVLQESTPFFPVIGDAQFLIDTTGHYEFQIPQHDWSTGACGDELVIQFEWTNVALEPTDSVWILYGSAFTYFDHEIVINKGGCPAGTGSGDCWLGAGQDTVKVFPNLEGSVSDWENFGGTNLLVSITDEIDNNYMFEDTDGQIEELWFANLTEPGDLLTYDSITIEYRIQRQSGGSKTQVIMIAADSTATGNYCESMLPNLTTNWKDQFNAFTIFGAPSGANDCSGTFTTTNINTLEITFNLSKLGGGVQARVTRAEMVICYTTTGGGGPAGQVIRIQLGMRDPLPEWERKWWEGIDHPLYPDRGTVWGVMEDSKWKVSECDCDKHS